MRTAENTRHIRSYLQTLLRRRHQTPSRWDRSSLMDRPLRRCTGSSFLGRPVLHYLFAGLVSRTYHQGSSNTAGPHNLTPSPHPACTSQTSHCHWVSLDCSAPRHTENTCRANPDGLHSPAAASQSTPASARSATSGSRG